MSPAPRQLYAALWMLGSVFSFVAMGLAARQLKGLHDVFEIMLYRSLVGLMVVLGLALILGRVNELGSRQLHWHALRNTVHFVGQGLWFWALLTIPLAQLFAIEFTSPIWVVLLAPLVLGERLTRMRTLAAVLGFSGALIVAQPDFANPDPGVLAAAAAALCFAGNIMMTKRLTGSERILAILFWQAVMQAGLALLTAGWDGAIALPGWQSAPWLLVVGVGALFAHFCLTTALRLAPASFVIPIDFVRLPMAGVLGWLLYDEAVGLALLAGSALIVLGNWINIRYGAR